MFDWVKYGTLVRTKRKQIRLTAQELKTEIDNLSGQKTERDFIYRVENSTRVPTVEQFLALNQTLWLASTPGVVMRQCFSGKILRMYTQNERSE